MQLSVDLVHTFSEKSRTSHIQIAFALEPVANSLLFSGLNSTHLTLLPCPVFGSPPNARNFSLGDLLMSHNFAVISPDTDTSFKRIKYSKDNYEFCLLSAFNTQNQISEI